MSSKAPAPKIPPFDEHRDNLDAYIDRFERFATGQKWPEDNWAINLSALLRGKALDAYSRMAPEEALDYTKLKNTLLKRYSLTEEGYRIKFRTSRPEKNEMPCQFAARTSNYLHRWIALSKIPCDYVSLVDLLLREQFIQSCSKELSAYLKEQKCSSIDHLSETAERYVEAHGLAHFGIAKTNGKYPKQSDRSQLVNRGQDRKQQAKTGSSSTGGRRCYICNDPHHLAPDCKNRKKVPRVAAQACQHTGESVNANVESQSSNQEEPVACLVKRLQDCCTLDKATATLSCGHKLSVLDVACSTEDHHTNMPTTRGRLLGRTITVLRDSGCTSAVVRRDLVPDDRLTGKQQACVLVDGTIRKFPLAQIEVSTPYFCGRVEALCIKAPVYDLIIGNIEGAREPHDPDLTWYPLKDKEDSVKMVSLSTVETRSMKTKKSKPLIPLKAPDPIDGSREDFLKEQRGDPSILHLWEKAKQKENQEGKYSFIIKNGCLRRKCNEPSGNKVNSLIVVPKTRRNDVMKVAHDTIMAGHQGVKKTYERVCAKFYWPGIHKDVTLYCRSCDICQRTLPKGKVPFAPLGKMPMIDIPFWRVAMDLVGPIYPPSDNGKRYILTIVDYATRYPEAVPLKNINTETVAEALVDIYTRLGIPHEVLTDNGSQFVSDLMAEVNRLLSIKRMVTTPYHPICNGLIEKVNGNLKLMLKRMCAERPRDWDRYINPLLFAYREAPNESLGFSPFELLFGRKVRGPMSILGELWTKDEITPEVKTTYEYVIDLKSRLSETCKLAQETLAKSQNKYKKYYDRRSRPRSLQVGDQVLILLPTDRNKLLMQWKGPFPVKGKFNEVDYIIKIKGKEKPYHINNLKRYFARPETEQTMCLFDCSLIYEKNNSPTSTNIVATTIHEMDDLAVEFGNERIVPLPRAERNETFEDVKLGPELGLDEKSQLRDLIQMYDDTLSDVPGSTHTIECEIKLTTSDPVRSRPYPVPYAVRETIAKEVSSMLSLGVIERSTSPYASPIVLVKKKDNSIRFCVDFRKLNKITIFDPEPMPNPEHLFSLIAQGCYFSKIDLSKGYWQIPMKESSKEKTAFVTPDGQYCFRYMPFGLVNSSQVFTRMMRSLFNHVKCVVNYIDDLLIFTDTWSEHVEKLRQVFNILKDANLTARPSKCFLGFRNLEFLGHQVGSGRLCTNPDLLKKIQDADRPQNKKQIRSFLGLTGYYRRFVPNYAQIALPLTDLTRKGQPNKLQWEEPQENAFLTLKSLLVQPPILHLPDLNKTFVVRTDASDVGLGAILLQEHQGILHPIAYASKKLAPRERNYSTIERECLAIVWAIQKFEMYLFNKSFVIQTDHQPLAYVNRAKTLNKRIMGWAMVLQEYRYRVEAIPGKDNVGPDYLSRVPGHDC